MGKGPLDNPRLREVEKDLDEGNLDAAQEGLTAIGYLEAFKAPTDYLVTRMLFQRGVLDADAVAERLRILLETADEFPEARAMLDAHEAGALSPEWRFVRPREAKLGPTTWEPPRDDDPEPSPDTKPSADKLRAAAPAPVNGERPKTVATEPGESAEDDDLLNPQPRPAMVAVPPLSASSPAGRPLPSALKKRSTMPPAAGRYTENPPDEEKVPTEPPPPVGAAAHADEPPDSPEEPTPDSEEPPSFHRGIGPPSSNPPASTLFEIATLVDEGRYSEALEALEARQGATGPEDLLLTARALAGTGRRVDALVLLRQIAAEPLLEPQLAAACSRHLIELGEADEARELAERAVHDDPDLDIVRLTAAWATLRVARYRDDRTPLLERADALLEPVPAEGPHASLLFALEACASAEYDELDDSLRFARRSLETDPGCVDAHAASAIAHSKSGNTELCELSIERVRRLDPREGDALRGRLLPDLATPAPSEEGVPSRELPFEFHEIERDVIAGRTSAAVSALEGLMEQKLATVLEADEPDLPMIASVAATTMTAAPVWSHFAPFDLSLLSIGRLEAALLTCFATLRDESPPPSPSLVALCGAYLGEVIRQTHDGVWEGSPGDVREAVVRVGDETWRPWSLVEGRITGMIGSLVDAASASVMIEDTDDWSHHVTMAATPPHPWTGDVWPTADDLTRFGPALPQSIVGRYCTVSGNGVLDGTIRSLTSLDRYLDLVSLTEPSEVEPAWAPRCAVLAGAYLGDVLLGVLGGRWIGGSNRGPDAYRIELRRGPVAAPIAFVLARIAGTEALSLTAYIDSLAEL